MDPITRAIASAAAGAAAAGDATYVDDVFSTFLYEGNNSTNVVNNGIDLSGEGGLVWIKNRDYGFQHVLVDTERGATKYLQSNSTSEEQTASNTVPSFSSTGFTVGTDNQVNYSASGQNKYTSWSFRKAPGFFDIVTYTGTGSTQNISHSLGSTPGLILIKSTGSAYNWTVWHRSLGTNQFLRLNATNSAGTSSAHVPSVSSTTFTCGGDAEVNGNNKTYVAYVFAHDDQSFGTNSDEAIIKCGSYSGNGNSDGPEIDLGFEPQWLLVKSTTSYSWWMIDVMRGMPMGASDELLQANSSSAELSTYDMLDPSPTGFKITTTDGNFNNSSHDYIYMAIRRPHKPPEAATDVFAIDTSDATSPSPPQFTSGFVTDFVIRKTMDGGNAQIGSRLQAVYYMAPYSTTKEDRTSPATALTWDFMDGWSNSSGVDTDLFAYMFKRAPGFMDVVAYVGTGAVRTLDHNLGAVPELVICKNREFNLGWATYYAAGGRTKYLSFGDTGAETSATAGTMWGNTDFTSTQISLGTYANTNYNGLDMIAYLFASLDGISKIGTYSGTGSNIDVDCGFAAGARFVMIKRTDTEISGSTGTHWYIWDTTNGIVSGNDPYWKASEAVAAVTSTDYIDPLNAGFTVTSSAPAALNTSGGTYLFLAIA